MKNIKIFLKNKKKKGEKKTLNRYQNLSEEQKEKKCQYHRQQNTNLSEEEERTNVEYMRII